MMRRLARPLRRLGAQEDGAAAVEFALLLPVLAALMVGVIQYGGMVFAYQQMHDGVDAGAVYVMRGGTDSTAIHDVALGAWPNKPSDAAVTVTQACTCAGGTADCSSTCADGSYPQTFTTISATGTYAGPLGSAQSMSATQIVRTQ
ncbi:MAG: pilus assembly protein [Caulobacteraceae bacterium]|nr:pilus assembly protein [Caulobacteraceae bacterium]